MIRVILLLVSVQYIYITFFSENISIDSNEWLFIYWPCIRFLTRLYHSEEWAGRKKKDCLFCVIKSSQLSIHNTGFMVLNATCNNISVISWQSVLLVEETGLSGVNHPPVASHCQSYHKSFIEYLYTYWLACHIIETLKIFFSIIIDKVYLFCLLINCTHIQSFQNWMVTRYF